MMAGAKTTQRQRRESAIPLTAKFGDIVNGFGNFGEIRPASGHCGKPLSLLAMS